MKILYFFLFLWVIFALLDPDPSTQINADPCGSGSETLTQINIEGKSEDPDSVHSKLPSLVQPGLHPQPLFKGLGHEMIIF